VHGLAEAREREYESKGHAPSRTICDAVQHVPAEFVVQGLVEARKMKDDSKSVADAVHQMVHVQPERSWVVVY